jgi:hypothetical protein
MENNFLNYVFFMIFSNYLFLIDYNHKHNLMVITYTFLMQPYLMRIYQILMKNQVMHFYSIIKVMLMVVNIFLFILIYDLIILDKEVIILQIMYQIFYNYLYYFNYYNL